MLSLAQVIKDVKDNIENILNVMAPKAYVDKKVADLVNGAPEQLDTLQELSKALNNDKDFGATVNNAIAKKLDLAGGTITGNLTVNGTLTAKASTAGTADRALKADACTGNAATASSVAWSGITNKPTSFTPASHSHSWDSITSKPSTFTPSSHTHAWGQITGAPATATRWPSWGEVTGKPSSMPANGGTSNATNSINITNSNEICLTRNGQTDGGEYWFGYRNDGATKAITAYKFGDGLAKGGLAQITASQFNGNLNGKVAWANITGKPSTFAPSSHNHAWSEVTGKPSTFTPSSHNHDSAYPSTTGARATGTWGISISGWAANSTKWGHLIQDTATENNVDTWIPVLNSGKLQHTTKDAMVVGAAKRVSATADNGAIAEAVKIYCAGTDLARIAAGGKDDNGWLEIATADNSSEPIYVRQYSGGANGSGFGAITRTATLLDGSGNTSFPGTVTAKSFIGNATNDGNGRNIVNTYATKSEIANKPNWSREIGWVQIGDTIFQWGQEEMSGGTKKFNLRRNFPQAVGSVTVTQTGAEAVHLLRVNWSNTSQFEVSANTNDKIHFNWIAVGR